MIFLIVALAPRSLAGLKARNVERRAQKEIKYLLSYKMFYLELYVSLINYFYLKLFYNAPRVKRKKNGEGCLNYFLIGNIPKASTTRSLIKNEEQAPALSSNK